MQSGAEVIYQAVFFAPPWRGDADFLLKCTTPSNLGDFSYEVLESKLARTADPTHIMQLCVYSELLTDLQALRPANMYLFLGDHEKHSFRVTDFFYYYTHAKGRFEDYFHKAPTISSPEPCSHCSICRWHEFCQTQWEEDEHLSLVANIRHSQINKLQKAGIRTVSELATTAPDHTIPDLNNDVFLRLRSQAILQHHKATTGEDKYAILPCAAGKGFTRLSLPDAGNLFFDMEGDPFYPNGLEYLFGLYYLHRR